MEIIMTDFNYTIYIKSTPEIIWLAITAPDVTKQFWKHGNSPTGKKGLSGNI
jgi:hypothetical protein